MDDVAKKNHTQQQNFEKDSVMFSRQLSDLVGNRLCQCHQRVRWNMTESNQVWTEWDAFIFEGVYLGLS